MSGVWFLLLAVVLSVAGSVAVWARSRTQASPASQMRSFDRGLRSLAPDDEHP